MAKESLIKDTMVYDMGLMHNTGQVMRHFNMCSGLLRRIYRPLDYDYYAGPSFYFAPGKLSGLVFENLGNMDDKEHTGRVIDWGCGTGISGRPFIERGFEVDGIDFSGNALKRAKKKGYENTFKRDMFSDDFSDITDYDIAISSGVMGDFIHASRVLGLMIDSLDDESVIAFTSNTDYTDIGEISGILENSGFIIKNIEEGPGFVKRPLNVRYYYILGERE